MTLDPGTTISHYRVLSKIGEGGMGEVYLAEDEVLERKVALKILSEQCCKESDRLQRFIREAKASSALNHPNIITIYEFGAVGESHFIASELIEGQTLGSILEGGSVGPEDALRIATQVASALQAAHSAGIVHRDIKPDNVMVRPDGIVKVLDFGVAKLLEHKRARPSGSEDATRIRIDTSPGMIIGTANYMSPEQASGKPIDHRSDIFSFGVLLYELLTGRLPFGGVTPVEVIGAILYKEPVPLSEAAPAAPERLCSIVAKAMEKDVSDRYQDVGEILEDIRLVSGSSAGIQPVTAGDALAVEAKTRIMSAPGTGDPGVPDTVAQESTGTHRSRLPEGALPALIIILAAIGISIGYIYYSAGGAEPLKSVAVMPLETSEGGSDTEYLSDGLTDSLIGDLSKIPGLNVKARSTVYFFRDKKLSTQELGKQLDVQALLQGRVNQRGNDLSLSLELVDTSTGDVIWSEQFSRGMGNLIDLQKDLAKEVTESLRLSISAEQEQRITRFYTENSEAQRLYLLGRFHWNKRSPEDFRKAEASFKEAIRLDPKYALAYAGLADVYQLIPAYDKTADPKEYMPLASATARKAIELDGTLVEPVATLARIQYAYDRNFGESRRSFERALKMDPNYAPARYWFAQLLLTTGRKEECLAQLERVLEIEPFSLAANRVYAFSLLTAGKEKEAETQYKKTIELFPDDATSRDDFGWILWREGRRKEGREHILEGQRLSGMDQTWIDKLQRSLDSGGMKGYFQTLLEYRLDRQQDAFYRNYSIAICYAAMGDKDKAFDYLDRAVQDRDTSLVFVGIDAGLKSLQDDPRFRKLTERIGLPQ